MLYKSKGRRLIFKNHFLLENINYHSKIRSCKIRRLINQLKKGTIEMVRYIIRIFFLFWLIKGITVFRETKKMGSFEAKELSFNPKIIKAAKNFQNLQKQGNATNPLLQKNNKNSSRKCILHPCLVQCLIPSEMKVSSLP